MINNNKIKIIKSLQQKKYRQLEQRFIIEGDKIVTELLIHQLQPYVIFEIEEVFALSDWVEQLPENCKSFNKKKLVEIKDSELEKISGLATPNKTLAVVKIPIFNLNINDLNNQLTIVLDDIQDPGNMGTIIRTADWFGIKNIICSENSVDVFNPKVIQASMGAFLRVQVHYTDLIPFLKHCNDKNMSIYGAFLEGESIYSANIKENGIIILGNESKGISSYLVPFIQHKITIPRFEQKSISSESLNISIATAIICAEFKRRTLK